MWGLFLRGQVAPCTGFYEPSMMPKGLYLINWGGALPEIKEGKHCSCAKYKVEMIVWYLINTEIKTGPEHMSGV